MIPPFLYCGLYCNLTSLECSLIHFPHGLQQVAAKVGAEKKTLLCNWCFAHTALKMIPIMGALLQVAPKLKGKSPKLCIPLYLVLRNHTSLDINSTITKLSLNSILLHWKVCVCLSVCVSKFEHHSDKLKEYEL